MKCKAAAAVANIRQHEPYCHACIETGIEQKARVGTKGLGLISTGDSVLLALSGGASSAALLYCMAGMQAPADSTRPVRGKLPFKLSAVHIDCSLQQGSGSTAAAQADCSTQEEPLSTHWAQLQQQLAALATAACHTQQPLLLHLSDVFCTDQQLQALLAGQAQQQQAVQHASDPSPAQAPTQTAVQEQQEQHPSEYPSTQYPQHRQPEHLQCLQDLVAAVADPTGVEDLLLYLRDQLLLRAAAVLGCNRLLRGDSASRMAIKIISDASKGRGFSLPGDIQTLDGRHILQEGAAGCPCILQPLREVTHKELSELCVYKSLPLLHTEGPSGGVAGALGGRAPGAGGISTSSSSVNTLAARFVGEMEGTLPASVYTIIRTAAHLEPFGFTDAAAVVPRAAAAVKKHHRHQTKQSTPQQQQQQLEQEQQGTGGVEVPAVCWQWCGICQAPLPQQQQQPGNAAGISSTANGVQQQQPAGDVADRCSTADSAQQQQQQEGAAAACGSSSEGMHRRLCYSCNRQILQQVKPAAGAGVPKAAAAAAGAAAGVAALSLEQKMQRLKQLLPPGMLMESDSEDDAVC
jgi:hypothetical protein